ncbi:D-2-hydroxyacid dehydrogenase [Clostridia bacterium OttesenSCG-928-O13]|nr:D-2-hydroxyacid dehydrogenase [Clostridia bacterium OttesenSCG-928-O13]
MQKIVVLDGYATNPGDLSWDGFEKLGEVTVYDRTPKELIAQRIGDANIVIFNKTPIGEDVLAACPKVEYLGLLSTGYDVVDTAAAKKRGIPVTNIPDYGTQAVGQYAIALLLEICSQVGHHNRAVHQGRWESAPDYCFWDTPLIELYGKTMGIIGYGKIGQATGRVAQAMGMQVVAHSRTKHPELETDSMRYVELDELYAQSDVISLHCPLFPETKEMINAESIAKMKTGVILINNSRGGLINEQDLADALNADKVFAAGLDVVSSEPIKGDNPLLTAKNCYLTPHISWAPRDTRARLLGIAVENLEKYLTGQPQNVLNP